MHRAGVTRRDPVGREKRRIRRGRKTEIRVDQEEEDGTRIRKC